MTPLHVVGGPQLYPLPGYSAPPSGPFAFLLGMSEAALGIAIGAGIGLAASYAAKGKLKTAPALKSAAIGAGVGFAISMVPAGASAISTLKSKLA